MARPTHVAHWQRTGASRLRGGVGGVLRSRSWLPQCGRVNAGGSLVAKAITDSAQAIRGRPGDHRQAGRIVIYMSRNVITYLAWHHPAAPGGSAVPPTRVELPGGDNPAGDPTPAALACWQAAWTDVVWRAAGRLRGDQSA